MGDPIRNTPSPPRTTSGTSSASSPPAQAPPPAPASPEMSADEAVAELDVLAAAHRRSPQRRRTRRGPRVDVDPLSPQQVAAQATAEATPFFDAMEPAERTTLMEDLAEKLAGGIIDDMQGMVEVFNGLRERVNEGRRARGNEELPPLDLDAGSVRGMLEQGMEAAVDKALHAVLETALHAIFGAPSRLPHTQDPANSLGPLQSLERDPSDHGFHIQWSQSF